MTDENSDIESQALALFEQALEGQKDEILKAAPWNNWYKTAAGSK